LDLLLPAVLDTSVHNRESFSCGVKELDLFLQTKARKEGDHNLNKTFVLTLKVDPSVIVGYYTLSNKQILVGDLPQELTKKLPKYNSLGATLLGRFAIDAKYQHDYCPGLGFGKILLTDAKLRAWKASQSVGSFALIVDILVGEKGDPSEFYRKYGFLPFPSDTTKLFLPMATIEKTLRHASLIS
jgi:hypothetical protein